MLSPKRLFIFFGLFLAIYFGSVILLQKSGLDATYRTFFCNFGDSWYKTFGRDHLLVDLMPHAYEGEEGMDVTVNFRNQKQIDQAKADALARGENTMAIKEAFRGLNSWFYALMPLLFYIALVISSPVPWQRKPAALVIGIFLLHLYFGFRLHLELNELMSSQDFLLPEKATGANQTLWQFMRNVLNIEFHYVVAVIIWIFLIFRKSDFKGLLKKPAA